MHRIIKFTAISVLAVAVFSPSGWAQTPSATQEMNLYPANVDARAEIKEAEEHAAKDHKRVLLVFGANWCGDCHVLDRAFHRPVSPQPSRDTRSCMSISGTTERKTTIWPCNFRCP